MSENTVDYAEAVASAYQAVLVVDDAYGVVLEAYGIPESDIVEIQKAVRELIATLLATDLPTEDEG